MGILCIVSKHDAGIPAYIFLLVQIVTQMSVVCNTFYSVFIILLRQETTKKQQQPHYAWLLKVVFTHWDYTDITSYHWRSLGMT